VSTLPYIALNGCEAQLPRDIQQQGITVSVPENIALHVGLCAQQGANVWEVFFPPTCFGFPFSGPILDSDQDGTPDNADNCPNIPGPTWNQGCPEQRQPRNSCGSIDQQRQFVLDVANTAPRDLAEGLHLSAMVALTTRKFWNP